MNTSYRDTIDLIANHIRKKANPESVRQLKEGRISKCEFFRCKGGGLFGELPDKITLRVSIIDPPDTRLLDFIHEIFHIPFLVHTDLPPTQWDLCPEDCTYLETQIDALASEFITNNRAWTIGFFQECLGFAHTDFSVE